MTRREWLLALLLFVAIAAAYSRVLSCGFIWDDEAHLTRNPCVIGPLGLREIWTSTRAVYYPLVLTTFWALHKIAGLAPAPYHVLNVLMHAASALVLWGVLRQLRIPGAWLGAALWALHPVMVQSVAWITELKNTQSALFYLLSIFCFLRFSAESADRRRWWRYGLSLGLFVLAVLSKPSTVILPGVLALCLWWTRRRIGLADLALLLPFIFVSTISSAWTIWEQKFHAGAMGAEWAQTPLERLIIAGQAIWFYLGKLLWPHPLIFIYPRWRIDSSKFVAYLPLFAAVTALLAMGLMRNRWRGLFFAAASFLIALFPVLGFFDVYFFRYSFVSDHFQYLASMGPLALAGAAIDQSVHRLDKGKLVRPAVIGVLLVTLAILSWRQTAVYRDLFTLYNATLRDNPGCWMAHYNLGIALRERGDKEEAISHYRHAIALRPDYAEAHYNLARLLIEKGELSEALVHYERTLLINPADAEAHNNAGAALFESGQLDQAIAHYQQALALRPAYAEASINLANALLAKGDVGSAISHYLAGLQLSPNQVAPQYNLANALLHNGRTDEAIVHYEKALELMPENADAHANIGTAFLQKRRTGDAIAHYRKALAIDPQNVVAQTNLAWLLATSSDAVLRNGREAVSLAERINAASGGQRPVLLRILAAAYAEAGRFDDAIQIAQRALELSGSDDPTSSEALRKELALYRSGLPYHRQSP